MSIAIVRTRCFSLVAITRSNVICNSRLCGCGHNFAPIKPTAVVEVDPHLQCARALWESALFISLHFLSVGVPLM